MIVIPMAGESRRFREAGYDQPKYMLPLNGAPVFDHAVGSFARYFADQPFLFIAREDGVEFIRSRIAALGIAKANVATLAEPTRGQAETVILGLDQAPGEGAITIFNIDTFRPGFAFPDAPWFRDVDGYLEVFRGEGANWSYVRPAPGSDHLAAETAEKRPISDLCCTGVYHFARPADFRSAYARELARPQSHELYVAPLYNHLIAEGRAVGFEVIRRDEVIFCGVPAEYEALLAQET